MDHAHAAINEFACAWSINRWPRLCQQQQQQHNNNRNLSAAHTAVCLQICTSTVITCKHAVVHQQPRQRDKHPQRCSYPCSLFDSESELRTQGCPVVHAPMHIRTYAPACIVPSRPPQSIHFCGGGAPGQVAPFPALYRWRWRFSALPAACAPSSPRLRLPRARRRPGAATRAALPATPCWVVPAAGVHMLGGSTPAGVINVASSPLPSAPAATATPLLAPFRRRRRVCDVLAAAPGRRLRRLRFAGTAVCGFTPPSPRMSASGSY